MSGPREIISDAEIERVHGHANFGSMSKRHVVDGGLMQYALGYTGGHTQLCILVEHGLIKKPRPGSDRTTLTQKGFRYLQAVYGPRFRDIVALAASSGELA